VSSPIRLSVFDDSSDAVVAFDHTGRYVYANGEALRLFGTPELVGLSEQDFAHEPSCLSPPETAEEPAGRRELTGEWLVRAADGNHRRLRYRAMASGRSTYVALISAPGRVAAQSGRSSHRANLFHAACEYFPHALLLTDDRRRLLFANGAARTLLGVVREDRASKRIDDLLPPKALDDMEKLWDGFLAGETLSGVLPMLLPDGVERSILFRATARVAPGSHLISLGVASVDPRPAALRLGATRDEVLSFRERETLTHIARGATVMSVAKTSAISAATVRTHVRNAMRKLNARTRPQAVAIAIALRQIEP
jgi:PAS domain-containing protein